jgi:phosphate acetyltransferase
LLWHLQIGRERCSVGNPKWQCSLSQPSKGSAAHRLTDKVVEATKIAQARAPHLLINGELQADTALVPEIADKKIRLMSNISADCNLW